MSAAAPDGLAARALRAVETSLESIAATDGVVNAFTDVLATQARAKAAALPATAAGPLAGVPFAVKNLFDVAGLPTLAGSKIEREAAPATENAVLVRRLEAAGAVLVGALNMDEYAYGFTTENSHVGPTRNPHDPTRLSGGSSGGSAAAVAAGQVPLSLGSDTNGSIRVPASLCGVFGLKPTFGRLPRTGTYPFVASLDHLGPFTRDVRLLAAAYDAMQGPDPADPACAQRPMQPTLPVLEDGVKGLRIGVLDGWFRTMALPPALAAVDRVAEALGATQRMTWPEVDRARAAAFLITNVEGATLHLPDLRRRPMDFEPLSRDRFLAGALLPAAWVAQAQRVRLWFARQVAQRFRDVDVLLAPATPCTAPRIGTEWIDIAGQRLPARASMGLLTQPVSCIGLPVVTVPVWGCDPDAPHLPMGVQVIAAPWREDLALRVARALEAAGVVHAPVAAAGPLKS
jgi:amidase/aspartyl-tRNA(Asn)/glutamyl-tRNA(Gln) amidotransferase subunit A